MRVKNIVAQLVNAQAHTVTERTEEQGEQLWIGICHQPGTDLIEPADLLIRQDRLVWQRLMALEER